MSVAKEQIQLRLKIVFVGQSGAGKTCLLQRVTEGTFSNEHVATIGVDFKIKNYKIGKLQVKAQFWDTAGQQRFRSIQRPYYKGSNAVCLCFDLSRQDSFDKLQYWIENIRQGNVDGDVYLIGCKSDLDAVVPTDQILVFAAQHNLTYAQTSSKINQGVEQCFQKIVETAAQKKLVLQFFNKKQQAVGQMLEAPMEKPSGKTKCC